MATTIPLMICGGPKSGTSSLVAVLNSHPDALILFETDLNAVMPGKYARRLIEAFPDSRSLMYARDDEADAYRDLQAFAAAKGCRYQMVGDKLPTYDARFFGRLAGFRLVYSLRAPDEWLAKSCSLYADRQDVRPVMYQYFKGLVQAHLHPDCMIVRFGDFMKNNEAVVRALFRFAGLSAGPQQLRWWETAAHPADPFKRCQDWWKGHPSSLARPMFNDTRTVRRDHAFWTLCDRCFAPYLDASPGTITRAQAKADLAAFRSVFDGPPIALEDVIDARTQVSSVKNRGLKRLFSWGRAKKGR